MAPQPCGHRAQAIRQVAGQRLQKHRPDLWSGSLGVRQLAHALKHGARKMQQPFTIVGAGLGGLTYVALAFATRAITLAEVKGLLRKA